MKKAIITIAALSLFLLSACSLEPPQWAKPSNTKHKKRIHYRALRLHIEQSVLRFIKRRRCKGSQKTGHEGHYCRCSK